MKERIQKFWKQNGFYTVLTGALVVVLSISGIAGYRSGIKDKNTEDNVAQNIAQNTAEKVSAPTNNPTDEKMAEDSEAANADVAYFRFAFDENQVLLDQILANGSDGTGLTIRIKVNYTTAGGMKAYQYFEYTNELVASYYQYASGWQNAAFKLYLNGVESLADLSFTAEIVSVGPNGTSVIKSSVPL